MMKPLNAKHQPILRVLSILLLLVVLLPASQAQLRTPTVETFENALVQLENAASTFTTDYGRPPSGFHEFVTPGTLGSSTNSTGGQFILSLARVGVPSAPPCIVTPQIITCSGGRANTRFPTLKGNALFRFNNGPGTFSYEVGR